MNICTETVSSGQVLNIRWIQIVAESLTVALDLQVAVIY